MSDSDGAGEDGNRDFDDNEQQQREQRIGERHSLIGYLEDEEEEEEEEGNLAPSPRRSREGIGRLAVRMEEEGPHNVSSLFTALDESMEIGGQNTGGAETTFGGTTGGELNEEEEEGDDDEAMTPAEVLQVMTRAFVNESLAPKLLPHKHNYVDCLVDQVEHMEANIARQTDRTDIRCTSHKMEIYRVQHILNSYLRARLRKIEADPHEVLREHQQRLQQAGQASTSASLLSQGAGGWGEGGEELLDGRELAFAQRCLEMNNSLLFDSFLAEIPPSMATVPVARSRAHRDRVFIQVLKEGLEEVPVPDLSDANTDTYVPLEKGSRHLIPYNSIEGLLAKGDVSLL